MPAAMVHKVFFMFILLNVLPGRVASSEWNALYEIYSNYIWRGQKIGKGPAVQPTITWSNKRFSADLWGTVCISDEMSPEINLYLNYKWFLGTNTVAYTTLFNYYYPEMPFFDVASYSAGPLIRIETGCLTFSGAYVLSVSGSSFYSDASASAGNFSVIVGAGNGEYSKTGQLQFCNVQIQYSNSVKLSDKFELPYNTSVIYNPSFNQFYIVAGIGFQKISVRKFLPYR
jgi:hypothetical protein